MAENETKPTGGPPPLPQQPPPEPARTAMRPAPLEINQRVSYQGKFYTVTGLRYGRYGGGGQVIWNANITAAGAVNRFPFDTAHWVVCDELEAVK